jgi:hypothetical protein
MFIPDFSKYILKVADNQLRWEQIAAQRSMRKSECGLSSPFPTNSYVFVQLCHRHRTTGINSGQVSQITKAFRVFPITNCSL